MLISNASYKRNVAIIYAVALFLDRLDLTIVNITLPTISKAFNVSIVTTDWISISFLISMAIFIPISSWLGERFGLKRVFIFSLFLFGLGSTLSSLAPNIHILITLRFIQGIGGGMLIPVGMTFVYRLYPRSEYASITSYTFIPALIAPAIAPFIGGVLLTLIGWRYVFLFSGPICLIVAVISIFILREFDRIKPNKFDWLGFIIVSIFFIEIFILFSKLGDKNNFGSNIIYMLGTLPVLLIFFIIREKYAEHPIIKLDFFRKKIFNKAILIQLCFQSVHFGGFFLVGMYLQIGADISAIWTGIIIGMQAVGAMLVSRFSVRLFKKSERFPIILGFLGVAIISPCVLLIHSQNYLLLGLVIFFVRGIFSGLCGTPIQTLSVIGFDKNDIGSVSAIFNIFRQVSISFGVAISSLLIGIGLEGTSDWNTGETMNLHQSLSVFSYGFIAITVIALIGSMIAITIKPKSWE